MRSDDVFSAPETTAMAAAADAEFTEVAEAPDEPCLLGVVGEARPSEKESWWRLWACFQNPGRKYVLYVA